MKFKPYPKYMASDVEWLGDVPEHWKIISIKWLSPVSRGASPRPIDDPKYFDETGEYAWVRIADVSATSSGRLLETTQRLSELGSSLSVKIEPGKLFISIAGTVGKPCISEIKACIHDGFVYFPALSIDPNFVYRIFEAGTCYGGLGKMGTQLNLNTDTIGSIRIALPPTDEIADIATFLDHETAKIDTLIAKQERLIELLKEKRQAVISHAVTKGLDPSVPMKPSGIEWLGDVPRHWAIQKLGRIVEVGNGSTPLRDNTTYWKDGSVPWLNSSVVNDDEVAGVSDFITAIALAECHLPMVSAGSILIGLTGQGKTRGMATMLPFDATINQHLAYVKTERTTLYNRFLLRLFRAMYSHLRFLSDSEGSTKGALTCDALKRLTVPIPPLHEQQAIVAHLDSVTTKFDTLIAKAQQAIALQKEHRTALISAAVTGKIDVRNEIEEKKAA